MHNNAAKRGERFENLSGASHPGRKFAGHLERAGGNGFRGENPCVRKRELAKGFAGGRGLGASDSGEDQETDGAGKNFHQSLPRIGLTVRHLTPQDASGARQWHLGEAPHGTDGGIIAF